MEVESYVDTHVLKGRAEASIKPLFRCIPRPVFLQTIRYGPIEMLSTIMSNHGRTTEFPITARSKIRRQPQFGSYSREDVYGVLDASPLCHVGYVIDGAPFVTPTLHWRKGNRVFWHGSIGSRFLRHVDGAAVCITCTLMDGYVLARSAYSHAVNYRSAMVFGIARVLTGLDEKAVALQELTDGLFPGRWETLRPVQENELNGTSVLWLEIEEATIKRRSGPPADVDESDVQVWAGVIPVNATLASPVPAPELPEGVTLPESLASLVASGRLR